MFDPPLDNRRRRRLLAPLLASNGPRFYDLLSIVVGVWLIVAAALKAYQLSTEPTPEATLLTSRWFLITLVELELAFGLWLLAGFRPRETRWGAIVCLAAFAAVSLYRAISGADSCGCFGKIAVSPWLTFTLDAAFLAALWGSRSKLAVRRAPGKNGDCAADASNECLRSMRFVAVCALYAVLGVPVGWAMASFDSARLSANGRFNVDAPAVVLEPQKWIGKPFPLSEDIDIGNQLATGRWTVVLYREDCLACQAAIDQYEALSEPSSGVLLNGSTAFVQVPPFSKHGSGISKLRSAGYVSGRLSAQRRWFVTTPTKIELNEGIVVAVLSG